MVRRIYCTRCKHELAMHKVAGELRPCDASRKDGERCLCPNFANPNRLIKPPADYKPREDK